MGRRREVKIKGISKTPLNRRAYIKVIRHYYKGPYDIHIHFDPRLAEYGEHTFDNRKKIHFIRISPEVCKYGKSNTKWDTNGKTVTASLVRMNKFDFVCRILSVTLHELVHATQCDRDIKEYWRLASDMHESIRQSFMRYELSPLESEAEGRALLNFNKALERYQEWCEE